MARDERFRKYQEAGADFLETARARAEDFLRELSKAGGTTQGRGKDALDDLLEGSRKGTEQLLGSIRDEIRSQLSLLGLATKEDLASLERRLGGSGASRSTAGTKSTSASKSASSKAAAPRKTAAKKASGSAKSGSTARKTTSSSKSTAKRSTPAKKATGQA